MQENERVKTTPEMKIIWKTRQPVSHSTSHNVQKFRLNNKLRSYQLVRLFVQQLYYWHSLDYLLQISPEINANTNSTSTHPQNTSMLEKKTNYKKHQKLKKRSFLRRQTTMFGVLLLECIFRNENKQTATTNYRVYLVTLTGFIVNVTLKWPITSATQNAIGGWGGEEG